MKTILVSACTVFLCLFGLLTFADKIVIKGDPVVLGEKNGVFFIPNSYQTNTSANYVTIRNKQQVCYNDLQPNLSVLDRKTVAVDIQGIIVHWNCYDYSSAYFTITP